MATHKVIVVNGLGGEIAPLRRAMRYWPRFGIQPVFYFFDWQEKGVDFEIRFLDFLKEVDAIADAGGELSLIGSSAGASLVLNAFMARKEKISHVINLCGPVRKEPLGSFRKIVWWKKRSPLLMQSVDRIEKAQENFSESDRKKIMTVRAFFGDELVPPETVVIQGAHNIQIPTPEHILTIYLSLSVFKAKLIDFLKDQ